MRDISPDVPGTVTEAGPHSLGMKADDRACTTDEEFYRFLLDVAYRQTALFLLSTRLTKPSLTGMGS